ENARLYQSAQRQAGEMAALAEVGRDIASTLETTAVLESISDSALNLLDATSSAVFLVSPDGKHLRPDVVTGQDADEIKASSIEIGVGIIGNLAADKKAEFLNDVANDPRGIHIPGTPQLSEERMMAAPLLSGDRLTGMLVVWRLGEKPDFTANDLQFLDGLARQAAIAIENASLFENSSRRAAEMAALNEIGTEISETLDMETVLNRIAGHAMEKLRAKDVVV
ncbi:MAG: GAF domain-containing protein, partial [Desulfuromonadales bacterium]|nr:GAF domain-containing protein [Desulfuromonadales bacterium]NIS40266.1 GAF domain-containing protein [Desulfuromonadales bacterium]